jgi:hypothetical protein
MWKFYNNIADIKPHCNWNVRLQVRLGFDVVSLQRLVLRFIILAVILVGSNIIVAQYVNSLVLPISSNSTYSICCGFAMDLLYSYSICCGQVESRTPLFQFFVESTTNPQHLDMSRCCGFLEDLSKSCGFAVQLVVEQIHNKSN